jgi:pimeloyl-ACP methyl ester carboxylesterase
MARNEAVRALLLFGPSDHVIYPAFDEMAAVVFPDHLGPHRLERCGHFVPWERPDALVEGTLQLCRDLLGKRF